jgi:hypothetical protein
MRILLHSIAVFLGWDKPVQSSREKKALIYPDLIWSWASRRLLCQVRAHFCSMHPWASPRDKTEYLL